MIGYINHNSYYSSPHLRGGWGKGEGGMVYNTGKQLAYGDQSACELRTLKIPMTKLSDCLVECKVLLDTNKDDLIEKAKKVVATMGLQQKPRTKNDIRTYTNGHFPVQL